MSADRGATSLIIAIPLYRAPGLVAGLFETLAALSDEIAEIDGRIMLVNDSPDDLGLRAELDARLPALAAAVPTELIENPENLGFVRAANVALARARVDGEDIVLLNSDALPTPGALREMAAVARLDPMTVVVSPRSNNATICNSPHPERFRGRDLTSSLRDHEAISRRLPRVSYVPTAVGFCLYIRSFALREFGLFDEIYGRGYNEENDFIRRCNRRGYRAVLANRAYVWHVGNASFSQLGTSPEDHEAANRRILDQRYPEYDMIVRRHFAGAGYRTEYLLSGLVPQADGRLRILFDCRLLGAHHNGTAELTCRILAAFASAFADQFDTAALADQDAFAYHGLEAVPNLRRCDVWEARDWPFAAVFRIGQPFTADDLASLFGMAAVVGFLMLDTIALDCQQLDTHGLDSLWQICASEADLLIYISRFSRDQFRRRFAVRRGIVETVALCSTDVGEYRRPREAAAARADTKTILIVGNHYSHKAVDETLAALRARDGGVGLVVLGVEAADETVESHRAGELTAAAVDRLYDRADVVLFPSHYEGFGLPIMHALARHKPVVARRRPAALEIAERTPHAANLHLHETRDEMIDAALTIGDWIDTETPSEAPPQNWHAAAQQIGAAIRQSIARYDHNTSLGRQTRLLASSVQQRLRTSPSATTARSPHAPPVIRADFEEVAAMLDVYHGRAESHWLDRLLGAVAPGESACADFDDPTDKFPPEIGNLTLAVTASTGLWPLQLGLQRWIQRMAPGGRLLLRVDAADHADPGFGMETLDAMLVLLVGGGCAPLSRFSDGTTVGATALKLLDWRDGLDDDGDDRAFVARCYARILGREADPAGLAHHAALVPGHGREAVANAFYLSRERAGHIRSRLSGYFGG